MTIKIAVTWSCGVTDEYTAPDDFEEPKSWKFQYNEADTDEELEVCQYTLSSKTARALR